MGSNPSNYVIRFAAEILVPLITWWTCCCGQASIPTDVDVTCLNFNCSLSWSAPENITSSDDVTYMVEVWDSLNSTTNTDIFYDHPSCVDMRQTNCNLVSVVSIDLLTSIHFVGVSSVVNGEPSDVVEASFIPKYRTTLDPPVVNVTEITPESFTIDVDAPLSPYADPNTGENYRVDDLPPFKMRFGKSRFGYMTTLFAVQRNGDLDELEEKSDVTLNERRTFSDLHPYTSYRIQVTSWFANVLAVAKESTETTVVNIMTLEDVPSEGPIITEIARAAANCTSPDVSQVTLTWKPPPLDKQNGRITHYSIRYLSPGKDFSQAIVKNCSADVQSVELKLLRWQAYEFAILVCNSVGCAESVHKTLFNIQAIRKGSKCRNISIDHRIDQTLNISWEPPANFSECITKYLVTISSDGAKDDRQPAITQMIIGDTYLQVNQTLAPGNYVVVIQSFIRSGFDTVSPGDAATGKFIIEDMTVTNHLILPLVITFTFLLCAILVAFVICAKWILRPFDFHLEKTRALKLARAYNPEPNHYHHTEEERYDSLPGSRRSSRSSITSFRPSRSSNPRLMFRNDSTSSVGNRLASQSETGFARLPSHVEEPGEEETLLAQVTYSPISTRKTKNLECGDHTTSQPMHPLPVSFSSVDSSTGRYPMLTIEISRDNSAPRVVKWKAGGYETDFDEEEDPFELPKAEDFDDADICVRDTRGPNGSPHTKTAKSAAYSRLISSDSSSSGDSKQRLNYVSLASQPSENAEPGGSSPPIIIDDVNPALFAPVIEEGSEYDGDPDRVQYARLAASSPASNSDQHDSIQYSQLASAQPVNIGAAVPAPPLASSSANIHPYSQIANSERNDHVTQNESASTAARRTTNGEGYTQLGRATGNPHIPPSSGLRDARTESNASQSYIQLDGDNSPSVVSSASTSRSGSADSGSDYVPPSFLRANGETTQNQGGILSPNQTYSSHDRTSSHSTSREHVTSDSDEHTHTSCLNDAAKQSANSLERSEQNTSVDMRSMQNPSSLALPRRDNPETSSSMQLLPSGSFSPNTRTRQLRRERSASDPPYGSVRVPIIHAPGSPLLPSRALDVCVSDSDSSDAESVDSLTNRPSVVVTNGLGYIPSGAGNVNLDVNPSISPSAATGSSAKSHSQSEPDAAEVSIQEMNGLELDEGVRTNNNCIMAEDRLHNCADSRTEDTLQNSSENVSKDQVDPKEDTNKAVGNGISVGMSFGATLFNGGYVPR